MQMLLFRIRRCSAMRIVIADGRTIRKLLIVQVIAEIISFRRGQKMGIKLYPPFGTISSRIARSFFGYPQ